MKRKAQTRLVVGSIGSLRAVMPIVVLATVGVNALAANGYAQAHPVRPPVPGAPAGVTAFVGVNVVPMDAERALRDQTVLVRDGWILALGPASKVPVPAGAARIDGRGKYLIPGLADMHAHLAEFPFDAYLIGWLAHGVTTLRNMDHNHDTNRTEKVLRWRAQAAAGTLLSPRIYTSGRWVSYGKTPSTWKKVTPADVAQRITAYKAAGYDFIKPYDLEPPSREVFDSLAAAGRREGLPLAGHVPDSVPLSVALATMKSIEHLYGISETRGVPLGGLSRTATPAEIAALAGRIRRAGVWNCPTARIISGFKSSQPLVAHQSFQLIEALQDSGAGLLLGADVPGGPGGIAVHRELEVLVGEAGLSPYQALATGTRNVAAYFGTLDSSGTIAVGKRADLVLLRGNPLENIRYTREPAGVMLGGRWLDRMVLDRLLAASPAPQSYGTVEWVFNDVFASRGPHRGRVAAQRAQLKLLADSLVQAAAAPNAASEQLRLVQRIAEQLGVLRTALDPKEGESFNPVLLRDVFDPAARVWLREQARQGYRVTIPGVGAPE